MGFLSGYRVLDLSDERGMIAGRMLADLGADVVQVEPPGGSAWTTSAPRSASMRPAIIPRSSVRSRTR